MSPHDQTSPDDQSPQDRPTYEQSIPEQPDPGWPDDQPSGAELAPHRHPARTVRLRTLVVALAAALAVVVVGVAVSVTLVQRSNRPAAVASAHASASAAVDEPTEEPTDEPRTDEATPDEGPIAMDFGTDYEMTSSTDGYDGTATLRVAKPKIVADVDGISEHGQYIAFSVSYHGTSGQLDYDEYDFALRGPNGDGYDPDFALDSGYHELHSGTVYAGSTARGWVMFDAPSSVLHGGQLEIKGGLSGIIGTFTLGAGPS
ncbi:hypothetical protein Athai_46580 [Actinocatenispora thailandica]|uniref:DUF4352 domain-containing protein n=1 Tax=Actinocatenispora thailandica TaxID=227318 RepID=A0A7R7DSN5_9ACTN|nr:DUF4352 domain-containing protein [Actinocatenispora thailandica]BCJ37155.1 hypothetical protein Athai_46580 [Actinocatenispora thailandica]